VEKLSISIFPDFSIKNKQTAAASNIKINGKLPFVDMVGSILLSQLPSSDSRKMTLDLILFVIILIDFVFASACGSEIIKELLRELSGSHLRFSATHVTILVYSSFNK